MTLIEMTLILTWMRMRVKSHCLTALYYYFNRPCSVYTSVQEKTTWKQYSLLMMLKPDLVISDLCTTCKAPLPIASAPQESRRLCGSGVNTAYVMACKFSFARCHFLLEVEYTIDAPMKAHTFFFIIIIVIIRNHYKAS